MSSEMKFVTEMELSGATCSEVKTRRSFTAKQKLEAVDFAEKFGNRAAGRHFDVSESQVRHWRKMKHLLQAMPTSKRARRHSTALWPKLEAAVKKYVEEMKQRNEKITTFSIRSKALELAAKQLQLDVDQRDKDIGNFKGTQNWCYRFMRRHGLRMRMDKEVIQDCLVKLEPTATNCSSTRTGGNNQSQQDDELVIAGDVIDVDELEKQLKALNDLICDQIIKNNIRKSK